MATKITSRSGDQYQTFKYNPRSQPPSSNSRSHKSSPAIASLKPAKMNALGGAQMKYFSLAAIAALSALFHQTAAAAPIYSLTAGTLTYLNNFLGGAESDTFSFTGPQPVSVQGGGGTASTYDVFQNLNVPFNITLQMIIDDTGNEAGAAAANGTNYGLSEYTGSGVLTNSSPITISAGNLTVSVPAIVSGELDVCTPDVSCPGGSAPNPGLTSNPFDASFGPLSGILTVTYAQENVGSSNYTLTNAQFTTTTPEPSTFLFLATGAAALHLLRRRQIA
jgi:hypothetical protein